jgi:hypothetical protein
MQHQLEARHPLREEALGAEFHSLERWYHEGMTHWQALYRVVSNSKTKYGKSNGAPYDRADLAILTQWTDDPPILVALSKNNPPVGEIEEIVKANMAPNKQDDATTWVGWLLEIVNKEVSCFYLMPSVAYGVLIRRCCRQVKRQRFVRIRLHTTPSRGSCSYSRTQSLFLQVLGSGRRKIPVMRCCASCIGCTR